MQQSAENDRGDPSASPADAAIELDGASPPRPENPPPPTCWPFVTAVGLTICFWGIVLNLLIVLVGVGVFAIGMAGLLGDWVREHRNQRS